MIRNNKSGKFSANFRLHAQNFMGVFSPADILAGIGGLSPLDEQIRSCHFALLGYDWNSPTRWVVIYFLSAVAERFFFYLISFFLLLRKQIQFASEWEQKKGERIAQLTYPLCVQWMAVGGSFNPCTIHVRFTVDPVSMYSSGAPKIVVVGSECVKDGRKAGTWKMDYRTRINRKFAISSTLSNTDTVKLSKRSQSLCEKVLKLEC